MPQSRPNRRPRQMPLAFLNTDFGRRCHGETHCDACNVGAAPPHVPLPPSSAYRSSSPDMSDHDRSVPPPTARGPVRATGTAAGQRREQAVPDAPPPVPVRSGVTIVIQPPTPPSPTVHVGNPATPPALDALSPDRPQHTVRVPMVPIDDWPQRARARFTSNTVRPGELAFSEGEILQVVVTVSFWWQARNAAGETGRVLAASLQLLPQLPAETRAVPIVTRADEYSDEDQTRLRGGWL